MHSKARGAYQNEEDKKCPERLEVGCEDIADDSEPEQGAATEDLRVAVRWSCVISQGDEVAARWSKTNGVNSVPAARLQTTCQHRHLPEEA